MHPDDHLQRLHCASKDSFSWLSDSNDDMHKVSQNRQ